MATHQLVTAEELERMGERDFGYELLRGELVPVTPAGDEHAALAALIAGALTAFVRPRRLGVVHVEAGYILSRNPDTVRGLDVAFVSRERRATLGGRVRGFIAGAPDLAVDVRSRDATLAELFAEGPRVPGCGGAVGVVG
jgi:Uma2 family endonuclease